MMNDLVYELRDEDMVYVGRVVRTFEKPWGRRRGCVHSVEMDTGATVHGGFWLPHVLYWCEAQDRWRNKLRSDDPIFVLKHTT